MRRWTTALDAGCARLNPALVVIAFCICLLDLTLAARRWTAPTRVTPVRITDTMPGELGEGCRPSIPPEVRDMLAHD